MIRPMFNVRRLVTVLWILVPSGLLTLSMLMIPLLIVRHSGDRFRTRDLTRLPTLVLSRVSLLLNIKRVELTTV